MNTDKLDACLEAYEALSGLTGAIILGDDATAKEFLDELYTYVDDLYDAYSDDEDEDDEDDDDEDEDEDEQPKYVTDFASELQDMCEYYEANCKVVIDFGDGDKYVVEVGDDD